jgi:hypothetical protein
LTERTYRASCQCQAVQYEAPLDLDNTMICNCSRCQRLGWVMAFTPQARVTFLKGEDATTEFLFNKEKIRHQFCPTCGIETHAFASGPDGAAMLAVNVNCLEGVDDPRALNSKRVDGRSR